MWGPSPLPQKLHSKSVGATTSYQWFYAIIAKWYNLTYYIEILYNPISHDMTSSLFNILTSRYDNTKNPVYYYRFFFLCKSVSCHRIEYFIPVHCFTMRKNHNSYICAFVLFCFATLMRSTRLESTWHARCLHNRSG